MPSKTYYALAAGAAILAVSAEGTELTELVAEHGCGLHVPPRDPQALAEAVRRLHGDRALLTCCKTASREAAERRFSRRIGAREYLDLLSCRFGWVDHPGTAKRTPLERED